MEILIAILTGIAVALITGLVGWYFSRSNKTTENTQELGFKSNILNEGFAKLEAKLEGISLANIEIKTNIALMQKDFHFEREKSKQLSDKVIALDGDVKKNNEIITDLVMRFIDANRKNSESISNAISKLSDSMNNHIEYHKPKN